MVVVAEALALASRPEPRPGIRRRYEIGLATSLTNLPQTLSSYKKPAAGFRFGKHTLRRTSPCVSS